jgi:hypothetical protein
VAEVLYEIEACAVHARRDLLAQDPASAKTAVATAG